MDKGGGDVAKDSVVNISDSFPKMVWIGSQGGSRMKAGNLEICMVEGMKRGAKVWVLQSFSLIVPCCFSLILVVYLLGEVDVTTPILPFFSFAPHLHSASLTFLWT